MILWLVDNLKCSGCVRRIKAALRIFSDVHHLVVDPVQGTVQFDAPEHLLHDIEQQLIRLGYPRAGTTAGVAAIGADLRSVVSCAIGRLQSDAND